MNRIRQLLVSVRESLWFVPSLMVVASIGVAVALVETNAVLQREWLASFPRIFGAGADGSRGMLTAIAGSMITVATLAFSLTIVAMSQVASQYSSRVLRNFMSDRRNQFVLGYFVSVFAYCLVVLRTIRGGDEGGFIPSLAVFVGLLLAIASIAVLIFFIHHIASTLQASTIIGNVADDTRAAVRKLFPADMGEEASPPPEEAWDEDVRNWISVPAAGTGFVQAVDEEALMRIAQRCGITIQMGLGVGEFVSERSPVATVPPETSEEAVQEVADAFSVGRYRTLDQDAAFGVRQLVDIALRALSPGINDSTTAVQCVDHLGSIVAELAGRKIEGRFRKDDAGVVRVVTKRDTFDSIVDEAFDQILDSASDDRAVLIRMLGAIRTAADRTGSPSRLAVLGEKVSLIENESERKLESEYNRKIVERELRQLKKLITGKIDSVRAASHSPILGQAGSRTPKNSDGGLCSTMTGSD